MWMNVSCFFSLTHRRVLAEPQAGPPRTARPAWNGCPSGHRLTQRPLVWPGRQTSLFKTRRRRNGAAALENSLKGP